MEEYRQSGQLPVLGTSTERYLQREVPGQPQTGLAKRERIFTVLQPDTAGIQRKVGGAL